MSSKVDTAVGLFNSGFNCAQSVYAAFCEQYGMDKPTGLKVACGLGGGVRSGEVCGAVTGAVLVIGLKYGPSDADNKDAKAVCYAKTIEFVTQFKQQNASVVCRELLGVDPSTEDGQAQARQRNLFKTTCVDMITNAVGLLEKLGY